MNEEDLVPIQTEGYQVGEKKTLEEYEKLDANDESLRKWKESLGLNKISNASPSDDPRKVIVTALVLEVADREDVVMDVSSPAPLYPMLYPPFFLFFSLLFVIFAYFYCYYLPPFSNLEAIAALKKTPLVIKEGIAYRLKIRFRIQHDVISGLKYLHAVKRTGITFDRTQEMLGSYGPSDKEYEKKFLPEEAPSGLIARGKYIVKSKFVDDDNICHLEWEWVMEIKKDWK
ncbi:Rho GDP-dissociation inhibitor [Smittium culicis]|uniref:Rho GDP-dissociation inhibitor n=1 Tax=Smittium culicis TaxID=133412 RepID=A0A1R1YF97_9FUNG|nr:Rho GDP-dissociation inhibitor [Smittium culicis]